MPKPGFSSVTIGERELQDLDDIGEQLYCRNRPETLRQMIRLVKQTLKKEAELQNPKPAPFSLVYDTSFGPIVVERTYK